MEHTAALIVRQRTGILSVHWKKGLLVFICQQWVLNHSPRNRKGWFPPSGSDSAHLFGPSNALLVVLTHGNASPTKAPKLLLTSRKLRQPPPSSNSLISMFS